MNNNSEKQPAAGTAQLELRYSTLGVCSNQEAREVAQQLFDSYASGAQGSGCLESSDLAALLADTYKCINREYNPSTADCEGLMRCMDARGDGNITREELEKLAVRILCDEVDNQTAK